MQRHNAMATAALVLGIASILLCSVFYISLPCGAIAIICVILSRDGSLLAGRGKIGLTLGIAGVVISLILTVSSLYYVLFTDTGRSYLEYYYRIYTGDTDTDVNGLLDELFPFLSGGSDDTGEESDTEDSDEGGYLTEDSDTDISDENNGGRAKDEPQENDGSGGSPDEGVSPSQPEESLPYDDSTEGRFI